MFNIKCNVKTDENYALFQSDDGDVRVFFLNDEGEFVGSMNAYTEKEFGLVLKKLFEASNAGIHMDCCSMPVED